MTRKEFEERIKTENLIVVHDGEIEKIYSKTNDVYDENGNWINNQINIYGCFYDENNKEAVIYITDNERGISKYSRVYSNPEIAYDELYKKICRMERIYKAEI